MRLAVLIGLHIGALVGTGGMILVVFSVVLTMGVAAFMGLLLGAVLWAQGNRRAAPVMAGLDQPAAADLNAETAAKATGSTDAAATVDEPEAATGITSLAVPFGPALLAAALVVAAMSPQLIERLGL